MPACWNRRYAWCASAVSAATRPVAATNGPKSGSATDTGVSANTVAAGGGVGTSACGGRGANTVSAFAPTGNPTGIVTDSRLSLGFVSGGG